MPGTNNFQSQTDVNLNRFAWKTQKEFPLDAEAIDNLLFSRGDLNELDPAVKASTREEYIKKKEKMLQELFVAAAEVLTDIQFQFFSAYYVVGMSEIQIASSFSVTQPYVSIVLSACAKKIKKRLKLS